MKQLIRITTALILCFVVINTSAQSPKDLKLPLDPTVKYGVLDNGMTYYIKHNEEPKDRASFYMIQNVGAILEKDSQNGLAHFLEHMAFNGTKHFPGKGILNTLEKHGVAFGYNINAYTAQDQTIYNLSEVPTDKPGLVDTCLLILNDWSDYLLLSDEEIDAERGVISEEWRTRRNANFRMYRQSLPYIYNHSKYSVRDVIGDIDVIKNFKYDEIRNFYHDWYRTDLQAIAIVGDFDADEVERKVIEVFSKIPAVKNPKDRGNFEVPDNDEMIFGLVTDKEADQTNISIYIREYVEDPGINNAEQLRESYIEDLFNRMMSQRISELLQKGEPPFVVGNIVRTSLLRNYDATLIRVIAKTNEEELALSKILEEKERAKRYGFTNGELERAKTHYLNRMENRVKEKDKITNDEYANEYQANYLDNIAYMDIEIEFQIMQALYNTITTEDFTSRMDSWFSDKNNVMVIQGPESEDIKHLSKSEAMALVAQAKSMEVEPYEDVELASSLINEELTAGSIVTEKDIRGLDAEEWTLSNGAKVVYRFADYEKDNISFSAFSPGGSSLYDNEFVPSMDMLTNLVPFYGAGNYDQMTLQKMLTGKTLALNLDLSELYEGMSGSASPKDFETFMQLIYLRFTSPRFDQEAHQAITGRYLAFVENMNKNPQKIMSDSLTLIITDHNKRTRIMDTDYIHDVDLDQIEEVYTDRYKDASDFTFFFVGNITKEELLTYVKEYIATIPSSYRKESWIDRKVHEPEGRVNKEIKLNLSVPKSTVFVILNQEMKYSPKNIVMLRVIQGILDLRFTESIREEEGGTYGVSANTSLNQFPEEKAQLFIMFDTEPAKAEHLKELVFKELESLVNNGPEKKDLSKTVENMLNNREENREHNAYWLNALTTLYKHGYNTNDPENYEDILKSLSEKDIQKLMKKLYKGANVIDLVFSPEDAGDK